MITRLFIDPGSKSLGYAIFEDNELVESGTIKSTASKKVGYRLQEIRKGLKKATSRWKFDEVHIEKLNYRTHYYVMWCVGVVVELYGNSEHISDDIAVTSWKSFYKLKQSDKGDKVKMKFREIKEFREIELSSDDQMEAILQGYFYLNKKI